MMQVVVSIYDKAAQVFSRPVFTQTEGTAIRSFTDEVNRDEPGNDLRKHPDDFDLYILAVFDDGTGRFESEEIPRVLLKGSQAFTGGK